MRNSTFLSIVMTGLCLNGLTWAGQTQENEQVDPSDPPIKVIEETSQQMENSPTVGSDLDEAIKACQTAEDLKTCMDEKAILSQTLKDDITAPETDSPELNIEELPGEHTKSEDKMPE